jgi:hypothetical protein
VDIKATCPICGFSHSYKRLVGEQTWPVKLFARIVKGLGRGKGFKNTYRPIEDLDGDQSRTLLSLILVRLIDRLKVVLATLETTHRRLTQSSDSLMARSVSAHSASSYASLLPATSRSMPVTAPLMSETGCAISSQRVAALSSVRVRAALKD